MIMGKVDDQWLFGECKGQQGSFPSSFVDHIPHDLLVRQSHTAKQHEAVSNKTVV
jgi:hypothetical protein